MCGEKKSHQEDIQSGTGSPPRVRGKGPLGTKFCVQFGITPACAGKSWRTGAADVCAEDHPRVCGEKCQENRLKAFGEGSPPRVRGKGSIANTCWVTDWITPACAGKRLKKAHKIKDFDPVPIRFHLVFRRFERWCSNLPTPDGNVPV